MTTAPTNTVTLTVRKLPEWVHVVVKFKADRELRSLNSQVVTILEEYATKHRQDACAAGAHQFTQLERNLRKTVGGTAICVCGKVKP